MWIRVRKTLNFHWVKSLKFCHQTMRIWNLLFLPMRIQTTKDPNQLQCIGTFIYEDRAYEKRARTPRIPKSKEIAKPWLDKAQCHNWLNKKSKTKSCTNSRLIIWEVLVLLPLSSRLRRICWKNAILKMLHLILWQVFWKRSPRKSLKSKLTEFVRKKKTKRFVSETRGQLLSKRWQKDISLTTQDCRKSEIE